MSVLRSRILSQGFGLGPEYSHPFATRATPMVMPLALVDYDGMGARYHDLHAIPATGDPNHVPFGVVAPGSFSMVVPAGTA